MGDGARPAVRRGRRGRRRRPAARRTAAALEAGRSTCRNRPSARRRTSSARATCSLRELALRRTADRVDDDRRLSAADRGQSVWPNARHCRRRVGPGEHAAKVVRSCARLAAQLDVAWHAVFVERRRRCNARRRRSGSASLRVLKLAQELGAVTATLAAPEPAQALATTRATTTAGTPGRRRRERRALAARNWSSASSPPPVTSTCCRSRCRQPAPWRRAGAHRRGGPPGPGGRRWRPWRPVRARRSRPSCTACSSCPTS